MAKDRATLSKAAVANYVSDGAAAAQNPIFSGNKQTLGAPPNTTRSPKVTSSSPWPTCTRRENTLNAEETQLQGQRARPRRRWPPSRPPSSRTLRRSSQKSALSQEQGQIAELVKQQQEAELAAAVKAAQAKQAAAQQAAAAADSAPPAGRRRRFERALSQAAAPPSAPGGAGAVQAAESQIGVPYVWGGESPKGSASPGFDCSGLTAWSWGQVGVGLPHYSGAQMGDSTPVPISDLQPGDLLFYGPGGDEHVAMYIGPGTMIEAPYTGASVWITGLRLGGGFVGAGRP